jgi:hypothetical protein
MPCHDAVARPPRENIRRDLHGREAEGSTAMRPSTDGLIRGCKDRIPGTQQGGPLAMTEIDYAREYPGELPPVMQMDRIRVGMLGTREDLEAIEKRRSGRHELAGPIHVVTAISDSGTHDGPPRQ